MKPRLLDLFCGAGGAAMGYYRAGFEIVGVDCFPQPNYPFEFMQDDALNFLLNHDGYYDAIHASPPCQLWTQAQRIRGNKHPDYITPLRGILSRFHQPWVIENVKGAPLIAPIELCGSMFGLRTYRHRFFESNLHLEAPPHPEHLARQTKMGRSVPDGEFMQIIGHFAGADKAREIMQTPWMSRDEMSEAIPPAYTEWIGGQIREALVGVVSQRAS